jgi:hypothetical protein
MAMAAMLALSLYAAMNVALRSRTTAQNAIDPVRTGMIAMDLVERDFQSVPPPTGTLKGTFYAGHQAAGVGDSDHVEFFSVGADPIEGDSADASPLAEGIRKVQLYVQTDGVATPVLVRRVTRNLLPAAEALADEEILCRNVRSFSLRYFDGLAWQETWDSTMLEDALPMAVAITLELGDVDAEKPTNRMTRIVPLACAKPAIGTESMMLGGVQ